MKVTPKEARLLYATLLAKSGGIACFAENIEVCVVTDWRCVPAGSVYVPLEIATPELVLEAFDFARRGRSAWPPKDLPWPKETQNG